MTIDLDYIFGLILFALCVLWLLGGVIWALSDERSAALSSLKIRDDSISIYMKQAEERDRMIRERDGTIRDLEREKRRLEAVIDRVRAEVEVEDP